MLLGKFAFALETGEIVIVESNPNIDNRRGLVHYDIVDRPRYDEEFATAYIFEETTVYVPESDYETMFENGLETLGYTILGVAVVGGCIYLAVAGSAAVMYFAASALPYLQQILQPA